MGYVTDSIQFRTGEDTPLSHFASVFNHVRDVILSTGMEQVSLGDWPGQMGDVVTGAATGNDVSLDPIAGAVTGGFNRVGDWVFKHPDMNMYVKLEVGLLGHNTISGNPRVPMFKFTSGQSIAIGGSAFSSSTVTCEAFRTWYDGTTNTGSTTATDTSRFPDSSFILRAYCGKSGFWVGSDGGIALQASSSGGLRYPVKLDMPLLLGVFISADDQAYRISISTPDHYSEASSSATGPRLRATGGSAIRGVIPSVLFSGTWRQELPGALGLLEAPHVLSTDKGIRVAQCQLYGAGSPIPLPLAMVQASFSEVPFRLDLDGSGERTWIPLPGLQAVQFVIDAAPPANLQNHCIYALPASDD